MAFVPGASVTGAWAFADEASAVADWAFARIATEEALVPALWWFEVRNIPIVNERRKRISEADTRSFLRSLSALDIRTDRQPDESELLGLARKHTLSVYDAAYLELAMRMGVPLATLDHALEDAAQRVGVATSTL